jgi:hypothetical protein
MRLASDGSWNVTVVDGSTLTGFLAADGSVNVVKSAGGSYIGVMHPCGALNVTVNAGGLVPRYAADGSINVQVGTFSENAGQKVTVVSGTLVDVGGGTFLPYGLLSLNF